MNFEATKKIVLVLFLLLGFLSIFFSIGWTDPDSFAFYNQQCKNGENINAPFLANGFFKNLPCDIIAWKIIQLLSISGTLLTIYFLFKKNGLPIEAFALIFSSSFLNSFLLNFEDDQLGISFVIMSLFFLEEKNWKKYVGIILIFSIIPLIWLGGIIPLSVIILASLNPILGIIPIIPYILLNNFSLWKATETIFANGFITNNLLIIPFTYYVLKTKKFDKYFWITTSFLLLTLFHPKFGFLTIFPIILYIWPNIKNYFTSTKIQILLITIIGFFFMFSSVWNSFNAQPLEEGWMLIEKMVALQKNGLTVYNDWGLGRYITFKGGKPSAEGSYWGEQSLPFGSSFYWLGSDLNSSFCNTIDSFGKIFLQKCD